MSPRDRKLKVLLVDEHGAFAGWVKRLLTEEGVEVVGTTTGGAQALTLAGLGLADIVLVCHWVGSLLAGWPADQVGQHGPNGRERIGGNGLSGFGLRPGSLSRREEQIVELLVAGASNKAIARQLRVSPNTVRTHLQNVFDKLGVHSRVEAVSLMLRRGRAGASL